MKAKTIRTYGFLNLLGVLLVLTVNYLSAALPINGYTPGQISDMYPNLFVPAGFTFAIWGIIYLLLIGFGLYQLIQSYRQQAGMILYHERVRALFIISCVLNAGWIFAWHYRLMLVSMLVMLLLLLTLMTMYLRLRIGKERSGLMEWLFFKLPVSVYFGWISVATVANAAALLTKFHWNGFGLSPVFWTVAVLVVIVLIASSVLFARRDVAYALVVLWAFFGILARTPAGDPAVLPVRLTLLIGGAVIVIEAAVSLLFSKRRRVEE